MMPVQAEVVGRIRAALDTFDRDTQWAHGLGDRTSVGETVTADELIPAVRELLDLLTPTERCTERETHAVTVFVYDTAPPMVDPSGETSLAVDDEPGVPELVRAELERLVRQGDGTSCGGCCAAPVGFVLHEPDDGDLGGLFWRYTSVLTDGQRAWSICEDCTLIPVPLPEADSD